MRTLVLVAALLVVGGCGDADGPLLRSSDMAPVSAADGCVLRDADEVATRRVAPGDTLTSIARDVYGDAALWPEIALANPDVVGPDGSVDAGDVLVIPFAGR